MLPVDVDVDTHIYREEYPILGRFLGRYEYRSLRIT